MARNQDVAADVIPRTSADLSRRELEWRHPLRALVTTAVCLSG